MMPVRIVVMAKAPVAGLAKTRLIPALGAQGAAALAARMLEHTVREALRARVGPVELCGTPGRATDAWKFLDAIGDIAWSSQCEGDLGQRLTEAAQRALAVSEAVLLIGTDCPQLTANVLRDAAHALNQFDAAMIPTVDGGYALLGLRRFDTRVFSGIPWSTSAVARETLARLATLGWPVQVHAALRDIDTTEDLHWLPESWRGAANA